MPPPYSKTMIATEPYPFPQALTDKIQQFLRNRSDYEAATYKEARARLEFIDPLLAALGWDVGNTAGLSERFKEVVVEPTQDVGGRKRAPDYVLRVGGTPVIFVEAKKPSVNIASDRAASFQARSYAWSAKLPIVVLTNFAHISIYNGLVKPKSADTSRVARLYTVEVDHLHSEWTNIAGLISRDAVVRGETDRYTNTLAKRGGRDKIDKVFLADLEQARLLLLDDIAGNNTNLTDSELLSAVQLTLDRIIFLRICEDRGIEPYGTLMKVANSSNVARGLKSVYTAADARYNSGLFHFDIEPGRDTPDVLTPGIKMTNDSLKNILLSFYPPQVPYTFSVMPVEILGRAYESFLAGQIKRSGSKLTIEPKPQVRKAGGVFYTPEWLTRDVVKRTLEPILLGKSPDSLRRAKSDGVRIVDPSCGSGSFLVAAYRYLLDWYLVHYLADTTKWSRTRPARLEKNESGAWGLSLSERKRILTDHVFGVDIDAQAVEVAKLSLLLVVLEDESATGTQEQFDLFKARLLPDLDLNVRRGDSLIGFDILTDKQLANPSAPIHSAVKPFDWRRLGKFQAVVGNPPWLMAGYVISPVALQYLKDRYISYDGKADLYYLFLERSLQIASPDGRVGLVVPNKMFTTKAASALRKLLTDSNSVEQIVDFQTEKIFDDATNYTQALILRKTGADVETVKYTRSTRHFTLTQDWQLAKTQLSPEGWDTNSPESLALWSKIAPRSVPLKQCILGFGNGVQTGKDPVMLMTKAEAKKSGIETKYLKPWLRGKDIRNGFLASSEIYVAFPYHSDRSAFEILNEGELASSPGLRSFLESHESELAGRLWFGKSATEITGQWWGLMYLDSRDAFIGRHLVTPSLSDRSNFALGDDRMFPTGTAGVTGLRLRPEQDSDNLLAILNSRLISTFIIAHSTPYQGGYFKFSAPYIARAPIFQPGNSREVGAVNRLGELWRARMAIGEPDERTSIDDRIDDLVNKLYGVTDEEVDAAVLKVQPLRWLAEAEG